jgi:predicted amidohydrolase
MLTARTFENTCGRRSLPTLCVRVNGADEISVAIVFANAGGPPGEGYAGLSQVTIPFVGPIARLGSGAEGMAVVDLDLAVLDIAEDNYKVRYDMARHDWHYTYRHSSKEGL